MVKKILLILLLILITSFLWIYSIGGDFDDLARMPGKTLKHISANTRNYILTREHNKLITKFGGQEKVDEMYKNSQTFCLNELDCKIQKDGCCGYPVNAYNFINKSYDQYCDMICLGADNVVCKNNQCELIYIPYKD